MYFDVKGGRKSHFMALSRTLALIIATARIELIGISSGLWRADKYYEANVTAQTISMEAYLNRLFDPVEKRVRILHGVSRPVYVSLKSEQADRYIPGDDGNLIYT